MKNAFKLTFSDFFYNHQVFPLKKLRTHENEVTIEINRDVILQMTKTIIYCKNYNFANVQNKSRLIIVFPQVTNDIITGVVQNSFAPEEINSDCTLKMFNGSFVSRTVLTTVYLLCLYFFIATNYSFLFVVKLRVISQFLLTILKLKPHRGS